MLADDAGADNLGATGDVAGSATTTGTDGESFKPPGFDKKLTFEDFFNHIKPFFYVGLILFFALFGIAALFKISRGMLSVHVSSGNTSTAREFLKKDFKQESEIDPKVRKIFDFIKKYLDYGFTEEMIFNSFVKKGWSEEDASEFLNEYKNYTMGYAIKGFDGIEDRIQAVNVDDEFMQSAGVQELSDKQEAFKKYVENAQLSGKGKGQVLNELIAKKWDPNYAKEAIDKWWKV